MGQCCPKEGAQSLGCQLLGLSRLVMPSVPRAPVPAGWQRRGPAGHRSSLELAVGSRDDPFLTDQGAAAEVGSRAGLGRKEGRKSWGWAGRCVP